MARKHEGSEENCGWEYGERDREELLCKLHCAIRREMGMEEQREKDEKTAAEPVRRMKARETEPDPASAEKRHGTEKRNLETISELLWRVLALYQKEPFYTVKGLEFTYYIKGNELFVDRKDKSITRASVDVAMQKAMELNLTVSGPKKADKLWRQLSVFGLSETGYHTKN